MTITTVGIDLAKNVFAVHCVDQEGAGDLNVIPVMISLLWAEKFAHVQTTGAHANRPFRR